jgi:hypothetical protein
LTNWKGKGKKQDSTLMAEGRRRIIETTIEAKKKNLSIGFIYAMIVT